MAPGILIFLFLFSTSLQAASCCGGGAGLPSLILGDYQGQFSLVGSNSTQTHTANAAGVVKENDHSSQRVEESISLRGSLQLGPLWQIGASIPYKMNTSRTKKREERTTGIGDIKFMGAYEFLPEYSFSYWRPRGFVFLEQTVPVSHSSYNATKPLGSDILSRGFYKTALGLVLAKNISRWDIQFIAQYAEYLPRKFNHLKVSPGRELAILIGLGQNFDIIPIRLGLTLSYNHQGSAKTQGEYQSEGPTSYFWENGLDLSYAFEAFSLSAGYKSQVLIKRAKNAPLEQSLSLGILKTFEL